MGQGRGVKREGCLGRTIDEREGAGWCSRAFSEVRESERRDEEEQERVSEGWGGKGFRGVRGGV